MGKPYRTMEIDIHDLPVADAKRRLERILASAPPDVAEITVIHGYRSGNGLQQMVRITLKSKRIARRILTLNPGMTVLVLRQPGDIRS